VTTLRLELLGGFTARLASGESLALKGRKTQALLACLALEPAAAQARERLIGLLWGDRGEEQARASLRQALTELRRALGEANADLLIATRDTVALDGAAVTCDAAELDRLAAAGTPEAAARAAALYRGDLLDGMEIADAAFQEWLTGERARLRRQAQGVMARLLAHQSASGEAEPAIATARHLLALDPLDETTHRAVMRLYAETGDRGMAIRQFEACRQALRAELDLDPEAATHALAEEIRQGASGAPRRAPSGRATLAETAAGETAVGETAAATVKPSILVLPFTNLSGDAEQEYFSDGITEDIITELSRFRELSVIGRTTSFHYKDRAPKIQEVGREVGVAYVVEGSVRKAGNRVRVTAQLVDAESDSHLWAERYDRPLEDIFAVQDEIVHTTASTIAGRIDAVRRHRATQLSEESLAAYDHVLRGKALAYRFTREDNVSARAYLDRAITLDPANAQAHAVLAIVRILDWMAHWVADRDAAFAEAARLAQRAVELDEADSRAHWALGEVFMFQRQFDRARYYLEKAVRLNPNDVESRGIYGFYLTCVGEPDRGVAEFETAQRFNPFDLSWIPWLKGMAHFTARQYDAAIANLERVEVPIAEVHGWLAASYAQVGRLDDARAALEAFLRENERSMAVFPGRRLRDWETYWHAAVEYRDQAEFDHLFAALRKAGFPE